MTKWQEGGVAAEKVAGVLAGVFVITFAGRASADRTLEAEKASRERLGGLEQA